jgi:DNA-binding response OmpR family regulator
MKSPDPIAFARRLLLVVDDDVLILGMLSKFLQLGGFDVRIATGGEMALSMLSEGGREPDLALLDVEMPGMDGIELARRLREEYAVPAMFLSANNDAAVVANATDGGAVGYLVKPVNTAHIVPSVRAALARADDIRVLRDSESRLALALQAGRETGMAVGVLMERNRTDRETAFRMLREYARSHQRKLNDVAVEVLEGCEALNRFGAVAREPKARS